jgi:predicted ATPase/class 3 adenylate cyclase/tetratricopeptide (TPR) repeat protein
MTELALVFTDLEGSTALVERLGDAAAAAMWAEHDRSGRDLIAAHGGREIDHSDGFFAVFSAVSGAAGFALGYQAALAALGLVARVGIHLGSITLRQNDGLDVARGAKPVEVEGLAKPLAARVMAHARGGQTLLSAPAHEALAGAMPDGAATESHGHYRLKGIAEPIELYELGQRGACAFAPPSDSEKAYRVVRVACAGGGDLWQPLREVRHNLVAERDAFVGRDADLHALAQHLDAGTRLVSVVGAGGCGKTRLVRRYAWAWLGDWPGGVVFADLSEARSLEGILSVVAAALEVPLAGADPARQLGHAIAARGRCLVVLDNFEQLVSHAEPTVGTWLALAAGASFVVTSRERLHLQGENIFALEPLPLAGDAVALFAVRARAQHPDFRLDDANRADVERIVSLLDGLPLAIELAAARVRMLSPRQLVERLRDRFALLAGARGVAARQATLRAAIDWSWDLLAPWEQAAMAQCSVFEGGFSLAAAEQVLDLSAWPDAPPALEAVQALLDKSLLRSWVLPVPDRYGFDEPYFGMYVSVHEYAAERLRAQGAQPLLAAQVRHGRCFAAHGSDAAIEALHGPDDASVRRGLGLELDNLLCAFHRAVARGDGEIALATYRAAWEVLDMSGPFGVAIDLGGQLLTLQGLDAAQRAQALRLRGNAAQRAGRMAQSEEWLEASLALAREAGDRRAEALARGSLGGVLRYGGRADKARIEFAAALQLHQVLGNRRALGTTLTGLGVLLGDLGQTDEALAHLRQALAIQRELGNRIDEANVLSLIAVQLAQRGALDPAREHFEASLAISEALEDRVTMGENLTNLGTLALEQGRQQDGAESYERALSIHREVGNRRFEGYVEGDIGRMHLDHLRFAEARPRLERALEIARETGERRQQGAALRSLGELALKSGHSDAASAIFGEAEALLRAVGDRHYLATVLCGRAELARAAGDRASARRLVGEASELATLLGASPESQLGRAIAVLAASLDTPS